AGTRSGCWSGWPRRTETAHDPRRHADRAARPGRGRGRRPRHIEGDRRGVERDRRRAGAEPDRPRRRRSREGHRRAARAARRVARGQGGGVEGGDRLGGAGAVRAAADRAGGSVRVSGDAEVTLRPAVGPLPPTPSPEGEGGGWGIAGYAGRCDVADGGRDTIRRGAFARTLARRGAPLPLLWQHRAGARIGTVERVSEDRRGLRVIARIDRPRSRAAALL